MTILPVVERELRVSARRPRVYWARFFAAGVAIVMVLWITLLYGRGRQDLLAKELFGSLAVVALVYAGFAGVALTADAISEEKREGTLGLLFLTDLKGYDVVLGKVFATSLNAFYGLLAIFPVMAISLLLGGVTIAEFWRMVLVLINALLFSVSLGILVSAASRHERKAQITTLGLILLISGGLPLLGAWIEYSLRKTVSSVSNPLLYPSPGYAFFTSFDQAYKSRPGAYWRSIGCMVAIWFVALIWAGRIVRGAWQDRPAKLSSLRRPGNSLNRRKYRTRMLDVNPFYWLAGRNPYKPTYVWIFLFLAGLFWLWLYLRHPRDMIDSPSCFITGFLLHTVIKIWITSDAGRQLAEDRKSGALELTLSTPLTVPEMLDGQFLALLRQFGWAVSAIIMIDIALLSLGRGSVNQKDANQWVFMGIAGMIIFVSDSFVLPRAAMWLALVSTKASKAFAQTVFYILILPWLLFYGFLIVASSFFPSDGLVLGAWFAIAVAVDLAFFLWASANLNGRFREVATQRFDSRSGA